MAINGYCVLPQAVESTLLTELRETIDALLAEEDAEYGAQQLGKMGERGILRMVSTRAQCFERLLENPRVLPYVEALMGENLILFSDNVNVLFPQKSGREAESFVEAAGFHRDFGWWTDRPCAVNCMYWIDDFTESNGATVLIPGSHQRHLDSLGDIDYFRKHAVRPTGPAGSVLLFDATIWHAAGKNVSDAPRRGAFFVYSLPIFRQQYDYVRAATPETAERLGARGRKLLGYDVSPAASVQEFRAHPYYISI